MVSFIHEKLKEVLVHYGLYGTTIQYGIP